MYKQSTNNREKVYESKSCTTGIVLLKKIKIIERDLLEEEIFIAFERK